MKKTDLVKKIFTLFSILMLSVSGAQECVVPAGLTVQSITSTAAMLSWNEVTTGSEVNFYQICIVPEESLPQPGPTTTNLTAPSYELLEQGTDYTAYVRSFCSGTWSEWSTGINFTTLSCNAVTVPYFLDFELSSVPGLPDCTSSVTSENGNNWVTVNNPGSSFTNNTLQYTASDETANAWFFTQGVQLTAGTFYKLSYRYGNNSTETTESLSFGYGTDADSTSITGTIMQHTNITGNTGFDYTMAAPFSVPATGVYYFNFHATSIASQGNLYIDDFAVEEWTCGTPTNIAATNITLNSATLSWTAPTENTTMAYFYAYSTTNTIPTDFEMVNTPTINLTNLEPGTTYYFFVRSMCGPLLGEWTMEEFTTNEELGLTSTSFNELKIYPNPVKNIVTINNNTVIEKAEVYNVIGQLVYSETNKNGITTINLEKLSTGSYLITLHSNNEIKKVKIIRQ